MLGRRSLVASCVLVALATAGAPAAVTAADAPERKLKLASIKSLRCEDDMGKAACSKGVKGVVAALDAAIKKHLAEATFSCGPGKKESLDVTLYWDHEEGIAKADKAVDLTKLLPCVGEKAVPWTLEQWPPIHFGAKAKDATLEMRYYLKFTWTAE